MDPSAAFEALAISLGLGLLVGLQRQRADSRVAGLRTFALITVLGTLCALVAEHIHSGAPPLSGMPAGDAPPGVGPAVPGMPGSAIGWLVVVAGLLGVVAATSVSNALFARREHDDSSGGAGITTEVAILVMFMVGVLLVVGPRAVAIAVGGGVAVLLQAKTSLHGFVARLGDKDLRAIMQFALIWLVVLPVLPDRTFGPYGVLNPHSIWLMVVLIVGISLGGYIIYQFLGRRAGLVLAGVLGGMISSTATTASFARRSMTGTGETDAEAGRAAMVAGAPVLVVILASTVVYARVLAEVAIVAPHHFLRIAPPIAVMMVFSVAMCAVVWVRIRRTRSELPPQDNPTELRTAVTFGAMYAGVLLAVAAARAEVGPGAIYAVAGLSGLTDMDAITLSVGGMAGGGRLSPESAWQAIVVALMSNMVFKTSIVAAWGSRAMLRGVAMLMGASIAAGAMVLLLWPRA